MKISVERKSSVKKRELNKLKEEMILKERLHINEQMEYSRFLSLYSTYGNGLTEDEFADIFLDVSKTEYYDLKKREKCRILKRQIVDERDIELMKVEFIKSFGLSQYNEKTYTQLVEMYNSVQTKLSFMDFMERVFDLGQQTISRIKQDSNRVAIIFNKTNNGYFNNLTRDEALKTALREIEARDSRIAKLKEKISVDKYLHINNSINKKDFEELYKNYGAGFTEIDFAEIILGIDNRQIKQLLNDKRKDVKIWSGEIFSLDELLRIREETIKEEKLHINEKINYTRFLEIYKKHARMMSEVDFALEILDIPRTRYNELSKGKSESSILSTIEVPEEFYEEIKHKIKGREHVYREKPITYEEFLKLYKKYGDILNELDFAEKVLEMDLDGLRDIKRGDIKTSIILRGEENKKNLEEIKRLREIVIKEAKLHVGDRMTGSRFREIYEKYGFGISPKDFALYVLDIESDRLTIILREADRGTAMLTKEKITKDYIKTLRKDFLNSGEHCLEDKINYQEFLRLYEIYGGKLPENLFARKVLFISVDALRAIKGEPDRETQIFYRAKISDSYISSLKERTIKRNLLYTKQPVSLPYFNRLYREAHTILSRPEFARQILEVSRQSYWDLQNEKNNYFIILPNSETNQNRDKFFERQEKLIRKMLGEGRGYDEIEEHVNLSRSELMAKINQLYETEFDKKEVTYKHIYHSLRVRKPIDESRIEEFNIGKEEIEEIRIKVQTEKESLIRKMLGEGRGYSEIGRKVCMSRSELMRIIEPLYEVEFDEKEVTYRYIEYSLRMGQPLDEDRIRAANVREKKIESIRNKVKAEKEKLIRKMLGEGRGYDEIEKEVKMPRSELMETIGQLYGTEFDKREITCKHIGYSFRTDQPFDEERVKEAGIGEQEIEAIRQRVQEEIKLQEMSNECKNVIFNVADNREGRKKLQAFISLCKEKFAQSPKDIPEDILDCLGESIKFLGFDMQNIVFYTKLSIQRMEYRRAYRLIGFYVDDDLDEEDRNKLEEMRISIRDAEKRSAEVLDSNYSSSKGSSLGKLTYSEFDAK